MKIFILEDNEAQILKDQECPIIADITEHVAEMYDSLVNSMDWGSGFLCQEAINGLVTIAQKMGYELPKDWRIKRRYTALTKLMTEFENG